MIPRWHIVLGAIFTVVIWFFAQNISPIYLLLIFLSSFLIDADHYIVSAYKHKTMSLFHAFNYFKNLKKKQIKQREKGIREKGHFFLFHTIEFHILIGAIGIFWLPFFYIFLGMIFHSLLDLLYLLSQDWFYTREFFFFNWIRKQM